MIDSAHAPLILVVEDDRNHAEIVTRAFESVAAEYRLRIVSCLRDAMEVLECLRPDLVLTDYRLPDGEGCDLVVMAQGRWPVVVMTSQGSEQVAVDVLKTGALDYIIKSPEALTSLPVTVGYALKSWSSIMACRQAEESLREQLRQRSLLMDSFPHPVMLIGRDRKIIAANQAARDIGASPGEFCWREFGKSAFIPIQDRLYLDEHGVPPPGTTHCRFCRADACLDEQSPQNDPQIEAFGRVYDTYWAPLGEGSYLHYAIDVTERKRAMDALNKSEEYLRLSVASGRVGLWEWDVATGKLEWNDQMMTIFGLPLQGAELSLGEFIAAIHPADVEETEDNFRTALAQKNDFHHEYRIVRPDSTVRWIEATGQGVYDEGGRPLRMRGSALDITERKKAEQERLALELQFQQTQKLESLGVMAGGIAHDFNNILSIIMARCSIARIEGTAEADIAHIQAAADRGAELCRQMLNYAGKGQIVQAEFDMRSLVDDMVRMLRSTIGKNVAIKLELFGGIPRVTGDATQIRQVVMNLIINAAEAIGDAHGEIHVALATAVFAAGDPRKDHLGKVIPPGTYVCLGVSDTGCGMDEETKQRIFEPFFSTKFSGRGLGMSATLGIIMGHKGALQLSSQPGEGSAFKLYLPIQPGEVAEDASVGKERSSPWRGRGTVLLVEDEGAILLAVGAMLKSMGFAVVQAANGKEALEQYRHDPARIDIVLSDMGMPVMNGCELFAELKQMDPALPFIISSGFGDADVTSRLAREELAGVLIKPYYYEQLQEVLQTVLGKRDGCGA